MTANVLFVLGVGLFLLAIALQIYGLYCEIKRLRQLCGEAAPYVDHFDDELAETLRIAERGHRP